MPAWLRSGAESGPPPSLPTQPLHQPQETLQRMFWLVGLQFVLGGRSIGLSHVSSLVQQALSELVGHQLSVRIFAKANTLDLSYFETPR